MILMTVPLGSGEKYQGPPSIAGIASHKIYQALLLSKPHIITMIRYELPLLYAFPVAQTLSWCSSIIWEEDLLFAHLSLLYLNPAHPPRPSPTLWTFLKTDLP